MATDIAGLFTTPDQYQLAQQQAQQAQALQYANLDPRAQAQYGFYRGGQQLGTAIGGALGGVDPQLQKITQRQQLLGMIDPSNPDSYAPAIQTALQSGDQEAAFLLRNEMMRVKQQAQEQQIGQLKTEDYLTQRGLGMQSRGLEAQAQQLIGQIKNPDGTINEQVKAQLMSFPQGQAAISQLAKVIPDLRKIGAMGAVEEDPFKIFTQDATIPKNVQSLASQYSSSLAKGLIDPEKVDAKVKELTDMTQRVQQFEQNQQTIKAQQDMMNSFKSQGMQNSQQYLALAQSNNALAKQQADFNQQMKLDEAQRKKDEAANKPLRPDLAKEEDADYMLAKDAKNLATDAYGYINKIKSGEILFGVKNKAMIGLMNISGTENENATARNDYDRFVKNLVSESLRLNKGTQTEGDAKRATEAIKSAESPIDAAKAMNTLVQLNLRKVEDAKASIERRRVNANAKLPEVPLEVPKLEPHIITDADYRSFLKNPKYPSGTVFVDPKGDRRVKP